MNTTLLPERASAHQLREEALERVRQHVLMARLYRHERQSPLYGSIYRPLSFLHLEHAAHARAVAINADRLVA